MFFFLVDTRGSKVNCSTNKNTGVNEKTMLLGSPSVTHCPINATAIRSSTTFQYSENVDHSRWNVLIYVKHTQISHTLSRPSSFPNLSISTHTYTYNNISMYFHRSHEYIHIHITVESERRGIKRKAHFKAIQWEPCRMKRSYLHIEIQCVCVYMPMMESIGRRPKVK